MNVKESDMLALAEYQRSLWEHPKLKTLFFELTDRCNLNCRHCGSACSGANATVLESSVVQKVLREVAETYDPRWIMIAYTGGEPLLHPDCIGLVRYARELGYPVGMTSNAVLIDEVVARELKNAGLDTISVSIDGIGQLHDELRRVEGSYAAAVRGILALKKAGIEPQITTVVHKKNLEHLEEVYDFAVRNDIYSWRLTNVDPIGRAQDSRELLLDHTDMRQLLDYIRSKRFDPAVELEVTYGCAHFTGYEYERMIRDFYFQCIAGTGAASVMANGDIGACVDIERRPDLVQGNAYRDSFTEVWEQGFRVFRQDRAKLSRTCSGCEYAAVCMGDSAHTWNYDTAEPYYCMHCAD